MKKAIIIFSFLLCWQLIFAQSFHYMASLPLVDSTGFYKILIPPSVNSKLKEGYVDLRILDRDGKETPYILKDDNPVSNTMVFKEYQIIDKKYLKADHTEIILRNYNKQRIDNLSLLIRNAEVHKVIKLSGSFDRKHWFGVKESAYISSISNANDVSEIKLINFPLTDYEYLKIEINDKKSAPINIIKAGYYETISGKGGSTFTEIKSSKMVLDSSKKKTTWLHLVFDESTYTDVLEIKILEPTYYLRSSKAYTVKQESRVYKKYYLQDISLNSGAALRFNLDHVKTKELWLEIFNEDNSPLIISEAKVFQLNHYCCARLDKGKQYKLYFGDSLINSPSYDLKHFQSIIPQDLKIIIPDSITPITHAMNAEIKSSGSIFKDTRFIWAAIIIVLSILGFVTYRMIKDINGKNGMSDI